MAVPLWILINIKTFPRSSHSELLGPLLICFWSITKWTKVKNRRQIWDCQTSGFIPPGRFNAVQRRQWRKCGPWKLPWNIAVFCFSWYHESHLFAFQIDNFPNSIYYIYIHIYIWLEYIVKYLLDIEIIYIYNAVFCFCFSIYLFIYRDIQLGESH